MITKRRKKTALTLYILLSFFSKIACLCVEACRVDILFDSDGKKNHTLWQQLVCCEMDPMIALIKIKENHFGLL
jgi:hypothetical protein